MSNSSVYGNYNGSVVICDIFDIRRPYKVIVRVVKSLRTAEVELGTLTYEHTLPSDGCRSKCCVLAVQQVIHRGLVQLLIQVKQRMRERKEHCYQTFLLSEVTGLNFCSEVTLPFDTLPQNSHVTCDGTVCLASGRTFVVLTPGKATFETLDVFDNPIVKLCHVSEPKLKGDVLSVDVLAMTGTSQVDSFEAHNVALSPRGTGSSRKIPASSYVPEVYKEVIDLVYCCAATNNSVVAAASDQLLYFEHGQLQKCVKLDLKNSHIVKIVEFENQDHHVFFSLLTSGQEVMVVDKQSFQVSVHIRCIFRLSRTFQGMQMTNSRTLSFQVVGRYSDVKDVLVDDFFNCGSRQGALVCTEKEEEQQQLPAIRFLDFAEITQVFQYETSQKCDQILDDTEFAGADLCHVLRWPGRWGLQ